MRALKPLRCTVRGCEAALQREGQVYRCERGHSFDVARAGYVNLLQPTDKRSQAPGDSAEAVAARVRLLELGVDAELVAASLEWLAGLGLHGGSRLADVGAGIGTWLGAWSAAGEYEAFGVDLSSRCAEAAAKRHKDAAWLVANADHGLPFQDGALDVLLSVKAPKIAAEFARVLDPSGHLLVVVSAPDDLLELRAATAGAGFSRDPAEQALELFAGAFELQGRFEVRNRRQYDAQGLSDLLRVSYRGLRKSEADRLAQIDFMEVTTSAVFLHLRPMRPRE